VIRKLLNPIRRAFYSKRPKVCFDLADWAHSNGCFVLKIHDPAWQSISGLAAKYPHIMENARPHMAALTRPQHLVCLNRAKIRDELGLVILNDGQVCFEGNWHLPYLQSHPSYRKRFNLRWRKLRGDYYSLAAMWAENFYHWHYDVLPRLESALPYLPPDTLFMLPAKTSEWQLESLGAFGIHRERLVPLAYGIDYIAERFWFATPIGHTGFPESTLLSRVARRMASLTSQSSLEIPARIYISRRKAKNRRILNESELKPVLDRWDFHIVCLEDFSLATQIRLFQGCRAVLAPHGAGLANILHCHRGAWVGELRHGDTPLCYEVAAHLLGLNYHQLKIPKQVEVTLDADYVLDPALLDSWLQDCFTG
jgi:hypothetical protein